MKKEYIKPSIEIVDLTADGNICQTVGAYSGYGESETGIGKSVGHSWDDED